MADALAKLTRRLPTIEAFIFDFYGTLVTDDTTFSPMWKDLVELGYSSSQDLQAFFEPNGFDGCTTPTLGGSPTHSDWSRGNWARFLALSGVSAADVEPVLERLLSRQAEYRATAAESAHRVVRLVKSLGCRVGLCSNWETPIEPYLLQAQLPPFDAISISAEVGARKPHEAIFKDVCMKLGVKPNSAVFVGDSWWCDVGGSLRAGLHPVWIRGAHSSAALEELVVSFASMTDFAEWLTHVARP